MAGKAGNRVYVNVSTSGTGSPFTTTTAIASFQTLAGAGFNNGDIVEYSLSDGANFEDGWGVVGGGATTITRNVFDSSNSGNTINLSGSATCIITLTAQGAQAMLALQAQRIGGGI
jgi:hypothetical protein